MHGFSTIYLLFGPEDAERLLGIENNAGINSKWALGLPFIPLALIAARTRYADNLLPILPIFYFASTGPQRDGPLWPPSASMTVAILPYIRAAYNEFYDRVCAPREKAWIKQIQPRAGDDHEGNEEPEQHQDQANEFEDGMDIGLDLQVEIVEDREGHEDGQPPGNAPEEQGRANRGQDQGRDQPPGVNQAHVPNLNPHLHQDPHPQHQHPHHDHDHPIHHQNQNGVQGLVLNNFFSLPQTIMGALLFPSISAAVGALLQVTLPRSWTTAPSRWDRHPTGFLQSRFGRSIVGGCLFVVLKDTLMLYSRYRLAQDHKKRRVIDYDAKKEKKATSTQL